MTCVPFVAVGTHSIVRLHLIEQATGIRVVERTLFTGGVAGTLKIAFPDGDIRPLLLVQERWGNSGEQ